MCVHNLYLSVQYSVHKWALLEDILVVNVTVLLIDKIKGCYWKQRHNQIWLWQLNGDIRIIEIRQPHWVIVKYVIYKYASLDIPSEFSRLWNGFRMVTGQNVPMSMFWLWDVLSCDILSWDILTWDVLILGLLILLILMGTYSMMTNKH